MSDTAREGARGPADPVVAWRYWQLDGAVRRLRSVSQRRVVWAPGTPVRAQCLGGGHAAPDPGCACGIYGTLDLDALRDHGVCLGPEPLVMGRVALWGALVPDGRAYRAQYGYPRRLSVVRETVAPEELDDLVERLGEYGVPVDVASQAEAVGDVSATIMGFLAMSGAAPAPAPRRQPPERGAGGGRGGEGEDTAGG